MKKHYTLERDLRNLVYKGYQMGKDQLYNKDDYTCNTDIAEKIFYKFVNIIEKYEKERDEFFKKEDKTHEIIYDITRLLEEKYGHDFHGILSEVYIDLSNIFKKYGK